jgi:hypothetical protein
MRQCTIDALVTRDDPEHKADIPSIGSMPVDEFDHFCVWARQCKTKRKLHPTVEAHLARLLALEFPSTYVVPEIGAVKGGRNDLIQYSHDGKRAVFELFFSTSQVPQDLRLLEQADAHWKIAILLDEAVKSDLPRAYFRKKPDAFPHLWLSQIMMPGKWVECRQLLRQLLTSEPLHERKSTVSVSPNIVGNYNAVAGGDVVFTERRVTRPILSREPGDISEETAHAISELIRRLDKTDELAGKKVHYGGWMAYLKNRYDVESYRKLTTAQGADAIKWLRQELGRKTPSLRRTNNQEWRQRLNSAIYAKCHQLGWDKPRLYSFAHEYLDLKHPISSLNDLGERNLEKFRNRMRRVR